MCQVTSVGCINACLGPQSSELMFATQRMDSHPANFPDLRCISADGSFSLRQPHSLSNRQNRKPAFVCEGVGH
jgi:hypothetical protein